MESSTGSCMIFYARNGTGELVDSIETFITLTGNNSVFLRSENLNPTDGDENYTVYSTVSMQDKNGLWQSFGRTELESLQVLNLDGVGALGVSGGGSGGEGSAGPYDVIVAVVNDKYEVASKVSADITILNTGDVPDEDTILVYWLEDSVGNVFGETKEQFLEIPPGRKVLRKSISLPENSVLGQWKFKVDYFTVVQPKVSVFDSFEVVEKVPFLFVTCLLVLLLF